MKNAFPSSGAGQHQNYNGKKDTMLIKYMCFRLLADSFRTKLARYIMTAKTNGNREKIDFSNKKNPENSSEHANFKSINK